MLKIGILQSAGIAGNIIEQAFNHPEHDEVFVPVIYSKENQNDKNVGSDLKFGNIQGVVVAPGSATEFKFEGSLPVYVDEHIRMASASSVELLADKVRKAWQSLKRDFLISNPRIAVVCYESEKEVVTPVVKESSESGVGVYGPYVLDDYLNESMFQHFDMTLAVSDEQASHILKTECDPKVVKLIAGIPMVMASTVYTADCDFEKTGILEPALALRQSIYTVMEIYRNRMVYDEAHRDPLQKLYHERRDDSEKIRFAVRKPFPPIDDKKKAETPS